MRIRQSPIHGPQLELECVCCDFTQKTDLLAVSRKKAVAMWKGAAGCYQGRWEFICERCIKEAKKRYL